MKNFLEDVKIAIIELTDEIIEDVFSVKEEIFGGKNG